MADLKQLQKPSRKGEPPTLASSANNLSKPAPAGSKVPLQLKISPDVRRDFKGYALARDMDASELFVQVWAFYKENHG
jgi:hypothetical protein